MLLSLGSLFLQRFYRERRDSPFWGVIFFSKLKHRGLQATGKRKLHTKLQVSAQKLWQISLVQTVRRADGPTEAWNWKPYPRDVAMCNFLSLDLEWSNMALNIKNFNGTEKYGIRTLFHQRSIFEYFNSILFFSLIKTKKQNFEWTQALFFLLTKTYS